MTAPTQIIRRSLTSGLYRLTVDGDAQAFDWESLYLTLNIHTTITSPKCRSSNGINIHPANMGRQP